MQGGSGHIGSSSSSNSSRKSGDRRWGRSLLLVFSSPIVERSGTLVLEACTATEWSQLHATRPQARFPKHHHRRARSSPLFYAVRPFDPRSRGVGRLEARSPGDPSRVFATARWGRSARPRGKRAEIWNYTGNRDTWAVRFGWCTPRRAN